MSIASIQTFLLNIESGDISTSKQKVYAYIKRNPGATIATILFFSTGMSHSTVTARISDLLDAGLIKITGTEITKKGVYSKFEVITNPTEALQLAKARKTHKRKAAIKRLLKNFKSTLSGLTVLQLEQELTNA